jgi:hypothetical protein
VRLRDARLGYTLARALPDALARIREVDAMSTFRDRPEDICRPTRSQCARAGRMGGKASGEWRRYQAIQKARVSAIAALDALDPKLPPAIKPQLLAWAEAGWLDAWIRDIYVRGRYTGYQMVYQQKKKQAAKAAASEAA